MGRVSLRQRSAIRHGLAAAVRGWRRWLWAVAAMAVLMQSPELWAVPEKGKAPAKSKPNKKKETRDGSLIVNNTPMPQPPDLRGTYEKARDDELIVHYQRLARLDYIAELATAQNDNRLLERVENVRRRETQRHRATMTEFGAQARARAMVGF